VLVTARRTAVVKYAVDRFTARCLPQAVALQRTRSAACRAIRCASAPTAGACPKCRSVGRSCHSWWAGSPSAVLWTESEDEGHRRSYRCEDLEGHRWMFSGMTLTSARAGRPVTGCRGGGPRTATRTSACGRRSSPRCRKPEDVISHRHGLAVPLGV